MCACSVMSNSLPPSGLQPARLLCPWNCPGKNTGVGCHFLLQGIFLTRGSNQHLLCLLHQQVDSFPLASPRTIQQFYLFIFFKELPNCFLQWLRQFTFPLSVQKCFLFSTLLLTFVFFLMLVILRDVRYYFMVSVHIFLKLGMLNTSLFMCWPQLYLLWKKCLFYSSAYF